MSQDIYKKHPLDASAAPVADLDRSTAYPKAFQSTCWMGTVQGGFCGGLDGTFYYDSGNLRTRMEAMGGWQVTLYKEGISIQNYVAGRPPKPSLQQEPLLPFAPPADAKYEGRQRIEDFDMCEKYSFLYNDEPAEIWMAPPSATDPVHMRPVLLRHIKPTGDVLFYLKTHEIHDALADGLFEVAQYMPTDRPKTVAIHGVVRDEQTKEPIQTVAICARRQDNGEMDWTVVNGASSRADGSFVLHLTPGLTWIVTYSRPKTMGVMKNIDVPPHDMDNFEVFLGAGSPTPMAGGAGGGAPQYQATATGAFSAYPNTAPPAGGVYTQQYGNTTAVYGANSATYATPNAAVTVNLPPNVAAQLAMSSAIAASMGATAAQPYGSANPYGGQPAGGVNNAQMMAQIAQAQALSAQYGGAQPAGGANNAQMMAQLAQAQALAAQYGRQPGAQPQQYGQPPPQQQQQQAQPQQPKPQPTPAAQTQPAPQPQQQPAPAAAPTPAPAPAPTPAPAPAPAPAPVPTPQPAAPIVVPALNPLMPHKGWMEKYSMGRRAMVGGVNFGALFSSYNWKRRFFTLLPDGRLTYSEGESQAQLDSITLSKSNSRLVTKPTGKTHESLAAGVPNSLVLIFFDGVKEFRLPLKCSTPLDHATWCAALRTHVAQVDFVSDF